MADQIEIGKLESVLRKLNNFDISLRFMTHEIPRSDIDPGDPAKRTHEYITNTFKIYINLTSQYSARFPLSQLQKIESYFLSEYKDDQILKFSISKKGIDIEILEDHKEDTFKPYYY